VSKNTMLYREVPRYHITVVYLYFIYPRTCPFTYISNVHKQLQSDTSLLNCTNE